MAPNSGDEFAKLPYNLDLINEEGLDAAFVEDSFLEDHFPVGFSPSDTDKINFFIRGTEHWIDFSQSYVYIKGQIEGESDTFVSGSAGPKKAGKADTAFFPEQNFWHTIFSKIDVDVNDTSISVNNANYPYIAFFQNLFNLSADQQKTVGNLCYWAASDADRKKLMNTNTDISGIIQIKSPIFMKMKALVPFVNVAIGLNRVTNPEFYFRWGTSSTGYKFKITQIIFKVRKMKVIDALNEFYERLLRAGHLIRYFFNDFRVFTRTYSGYGSDLIEDNLFHGGKPESVIFGFVDNDNFSGSKGKNPFKFEHFSNAISEVGLFVNGHPFPTPMLKVHFETKDTFEAYFQLLASLSAISSPDPPIITKEDFDDNGCTLFGFNLNPDQNSGRDPKTIFNQPANVRLHVKFGSTDATKNITLVIYYEMNSEMALNHMRQVMFQAR